MNLLCQLSPISSHLMPSDAFFLTIYVLCTDNFYEQEKRRSILTYCSACLSAIENAFLYCTKMALADNSLKSSQTTSPHVEMRTQWIVPVPEWIRNKSMDNCLYVQVTHLTKYRMLKSLLPIRDPWRELI